MGFNSKNISNNISTSKLYTKDLIHKWNSVKDYLILNHLADTILTVSPVAAEKYKFDLYGLMANELQIAHFQIYPHMLVNGYTCSTDYYGERLAFRMIDGDILNRYYRLFIK